MPSAAAGLHYLPGLCLKNNFLPLMNTDKKSQFVSKSMEAFCFISVNQW